MSSWKSVFAGLSKRGSHPDTGKPGLYSYLRDDDHEKARIHLRIDLDGSGLLLVNASRVMHLNPTAACMARLALDDLPSEQACREISRRFTVSRETALSDYNAFRVQLDELVRPDGACPIHTLELDTIPPFSARPSAPYRMDLALTYRCNNNCAHCYNARPRHFPELDSAHWKLLIDRIWDLGIPHVVFTGGEPTLRSDLTELVGYAQDKGMVTGLNTNGRRLRNPAFVEELVSAGLDHVQITLESHDPEIHNSMVRAKNAWNDTILGIRNALESPLYVMTNTTMLRQNAPSMDQTLAFLAELGVPTLGLNALIHAGAGATCGSGLNERDLMPLLDLAREHCDQHQQRLIWYTPTQYCNFDPMELDLGVKGCTAALYNMCVEPDGAVIPCQSYYQPLGSLLNDPWESIWEHDLSLDLRQRRHALEKCGDCALLSECGGGCPLVNQAANKPDLLQ
jgi:radical SAM protein with 4Fe4S-binding SPASM domain